MSKIKFEVELKNASINPENYEAKLVNRLKSSIRGDMNKGKLRCEGFSVNKPEKVLKKEAPYIERVLNPQQISALKKAGIKYKSIYKDGEKVTKVYI